MKGKSIIKIEDFFHFGILKATFHPLKIASPQERKSYQNDCTCNWNV